VIRPTGGSPVTVTAGFLPGLRAGDRADNRTGEPLVQPPLGVIVLARPPVCHRKPIRVEARRLWNPAGIPLVKLSSVP